MRVTILLVFLALASFADVREHRIPNGIPASLLLAAIVLGIAAEGFTGGLRAVGGGTVGLCALLPFYLLGGMGAGDVKLMAGAGALLGSPGSALFAAIATILAGGALAVGYVAARRAKAWNAGVGEAGRAPASSAKAAMDPFPYALAVFAGTLATLAAAPPWAVVAGGG